MGRWFQFAALCLVLLSACREKQEEPPLAEPTPTPVPTPTPTPTPVPTPTPEPTPPQIARKPIDFAELYNGITVRTKLETPAGSKTAAVDRNDPDSYTAEITLRLRIPVPAATVEAIAENDPKLPHMLTDFQTLMDGAEVSPAFEQLYKNKVDYVRTRLKRLDTALSRHNVYDCDTILQMQHPQSGRRVLLLMGDMDVNTDGSDGDRNVELDTSSPFYQPQTSYRWRKLTDRPNPALALWEAKLDEAKKEFAIPGLPAARNQELKARIERLTNTIRELKTWSFLVSTTDPFIVLPGFMMRGEGAFGPKVGDYAIVIYDKKLYPAIVGDAGPSFKMGEASLRLCQAIEPRSSGVRRPVSSLKVAYLVFPGTAEEKAAPPDLEMWRARCNELLAEIGGSSVDLHAWENLVKPWPTPTPSPTPAPEESETSVESALEGSDSAGPAPEPVPPPSEESASPDVMPAAAENP